MVILYIKGKRSGEKHLLFVTPEMLTKKIKAMRDDKWISDSSEKKTTQMGRFQTDNQVYVFYHTDQD